MPFPVEEKWIAEAESKLSVKLPPEYRQEMIQENGGEIDTGDETWDLYPIWDKSDKKRLSRTCNDIVRETEVSRSVDYFPAKAVSIGTNGCGDQLVFIPKKLNPKQLDSKVYIWSHETGELELAFKQFKK